MKMNTFFILIENKKYFMKKNNTIFKNVVDKCILMVYYVNCKYTEGGFIMNYETTMSKLKEVNYDAVIEAFEKLVFENDNDITQVTMNAVATEAGLTKRTVYKYFESKDELHYEVMIRGYQAMHNHIESFLKDSSTKSNLRLVSEAFYDYSKKYPNYYYLIMNYKTKKEDFINPSPRIQKCYHLGQMTMQYLIDAVEDGVKKGIFRSDLNIVEATILVWSFATGLLNNMSQKLDYVHQYYNIDRDEFMMKGINEIVKILK